MAFVDALDFGLTTLDSFEFKGRAEMFIYNGTDMFVRVPTGYGKSLCLHKQTIPGPSSFLYRKCRPGYEASVYLTS